MTEVGCFQYIQPHSVAYCQTRTMKTGEKKTMILPGKTIHLVAFKKIVGYTSLFPVKSSSAQTGLRWAHLARNKVKEVKVPGRIAAATGMPVAISVKGRDLLPPK